MPDVPEPDDAPDGRASALGGDARADRPAGIAARRRLGRHDARSRCVTSPGSAGGSTARSREPEQDLWFRATGALPDDPLLHACIVAYASDLTLLGTAMLPHADRVTTTGFMIASLDHVMWFHRPFRADEWLLYHHAQPVGVGAARGLRDRSASSAPTARSR